MLPEPPPLETLPLVCPRCSGAFQVRVEFRGTEVACPHCQQSVAVPSGTGAVPPPPPPISLSTPPPPPPTPEETPEPVAAELPDVHPPARAVVPTPNPAKSLAKPEPIKEELSAEPEPPPKLTREERERLRKRFRLIVALFAAMILVVTLFVLLSVA